MVLFFQARIQLGPDQGPGHEFVAMAAVIQPPVPGRPLIVFPFQGMQGLASELYFKRTINPTLLAGRPYSCQVNHLLPTYILHQSDALSD